MHSTEREALILDSLKHKGFISFRELERRVKASPATIRRDLARMSTAGLITRVRGGAMLGETASSGSASAQASLGLQGVPFHENIHRHRLQKQAIGRAAAKLCKSGQGVMIDGGSTTLQMCRHLQGKTMQVLTNSLHIVSALLAQPGTRVLMPGGQVFREQNIVLSADGDDVMPKFHAPQLFMGAASMGPAGLMQADILLIAAERRLIERAEQIIVLVDSSKFEGHSGHVVCRLEDIDIVVTDSAIASKHVRMLEKAQVKTIIARD
ncbi:MAG TPA: DeoR/GlpR family DNA-binding transcription regulator [Steroidobacteraceae bacterium]|jgi:DeoR family ulaG and ulaABCDEF operon transcriptional repressor|nr:DeoR/GlpR family DNA-binding transcription regulator [Steroidobacteraceae bacterium]